MAVKFIRSLGYAVSGIGHAIRTQRHMRYHLVAALAVCIVSAFLSLTLLEWAVLLLMMAVVISAEMINTAIEHTVNLVTGEKHPLAKAAKDTAAGAVLVAAIIAVIMGLLIIGPPLWRLLF
ncbi:diacylglycerol kinase family protein [Paenibacillus sp. NEAU-GSW1]|uniref:diacylglycerol kinase family protein n=1 Tax=Paenibacillus sp. NEAU-GSW1 TaxID=2682486 RepID=UPI0012E17130|nr:diacylglycerol kinase family protein [Paenibacillus sp. NEAU-GSW1]MUT66678.1 diacylglycerol kinase family protein [Paenibacillus sp. NEAU-GSW1]